MAKSKKPTWSAVAIANLPLPKAGESYRDSPNFRLVAGKGGLSARWRVFASGSRAVSVRITEAGKLRWRQVRLIGASFFCGGSDSQSWTDVLLATIRAECLAKQAASLASTKPRAAAMTLIGALDYWYTEEVAKIQIRASETARLIDRHIRPHAFTNKPLAELTHDDMTTLLSDIETQSTPIVAEKVRLKLLTALKFYRDTKKPDFVVPITKAMRRDKREKEEQSRDRVLTDVEIMHLWKACEQSNTAFSQILRLALLVPCRSRKLAAMRWEHLNFVSGVWSVPKLPREKGVAKMLKLPEMAMEIKTRRWQPIHFRLRWQPTLFGL
jgi:hypothetical protein